MEKTTCVLLKISTKFENMFASLDYTGVGEEKPPTFYIPKNRQKAFFVIFITYLQHYMIVVLRELY